jgi:hypothetical protein
MEESPSLSSNNVKRGGKNGEQVNSFIRSQMQQQNPGNFGSFKGNASKRE